MDRLRNRALTAVGRIFTISIGRIQSVEANPLSDTALSDREFSAAVAAITTAFGDPTRRDIYLFARESEAGVTAAEVAERFELHPNVARHHLDKLAAGGYLDVFVVRPQHQGAGRPSKRYRTSGKGGNLDFPVRRDDLLVTLLARTLALVPPDAAATMAEEVGEEYGRMLAAHMSPGDGQRSLRSALQAVADALTAHGFAAHAESRGRSIAIIREHCPFGDAATQHPVICAVDRGMVRGMLAALTGNDSEHTVSEASRAQGDAFCMTSI
jgi:predicted ArsR family transcriptional regulator